MRMAELGHTAVGIDLAEEMLAAAQQKAASSGLPVTFRRGDAEAPPPDGAPYDVILERHVIWTLPQPREAVQAWRALLKPGGLLVLIEGILRCLIAPSIPSLRRSCRSMVDVPERAGRVVAPQVLYTLPSGH